ncbi:MAG: sigma-70 family RNA polymerase sigma factor [Microthrixaceae bacterium]
MTIEPFDRVVSDHGEVVWKVCRALLPAADADDAWSETFISALRAYSDLRPGSNVRGWLVTIAHRKAIDQLRRSGRAPLPCSDLAERPAPDGIPEPRDEELWAALAALPDKQRAAVVYHHVAGLPYVEVAPLIDSSVAAARRSASDGIARLRAVYPKEKKP